MPLPISSKLGGQEPWEHTKLPSLSYHCHLVVTYLNYRGGWQSSKGKLPVAYTCLRHKRMRIQ